MNAIASKEELIKQTLRHAYDNSPYYAEILAGFDFDAPGLGSIASIPFLTRKLLEERNTDLLAGNVVPEYVRCTGGTTFGRDGQAPLRRFQTEAERQFWLSLRSAMRKNENEKEVTPLEVRLLTLEHGIDFPGAIPGVFSLPLEKRSHFQNLISVLRSSFSFPGFSSRVQILSGSLTALKPLTLLCLEEGVDPADFDLHLLMGVGWKTTPRWQAIIEGYWRAPLGEVYGLSEVPGLHALRCSSCGYFHFAPFCFVELMDLEKKSHVTRGISSLVATSLYPLNQAQPLIRYDTDELIDVKTVDCDSTDEIAFEYLGRRSQSVISTAEGRPQLLLSPIVLASVLGDSPDIAIAPHFRANNLDLQSKFGWQKYAIDVSMDDPLLRVRLKIELVWSPRQFPAAAEKFAAEIRNSTLDAAPALCSAIRNGSVIFEIETHEPGSTNFASMV